ncbi:hypothetical protein HDU83_000257, partial [Entophlyctis luteolus]
MTTTNSEVPDQTAAAADQSGVESATAQSDGADTDATMSPTTGCIRDMPVKHRLNRRWTLWFDAQQKRANQVNWHDALKNVIEFDTVEDFWGIYNNTVKASCLAPGSNFHVFQSGVKPMWEDPLNEKGGKWVAQVPKAKMAEFDTMWLNTVLSLIGESFEDADEVVGAVVSVRRQGKRLAVWTMSFDDGEKCVRIGREWKAALGYRVGETIGFQAHSDALTHNSSFSNKDRYQ